MKGGFLSKVKKKRKKKKRKKDFPDGSGATTPGSQYRGPGFYPWARN